MAFDPLILFRAPELNPISKKARSIPALNPFNVYGRVFFFSWWGFMVAFMSWYAWSPLITKTIKADLHLTQNEIANSNILALAATLVVRLICGPLCDRFGPRWVFAGTLLAGAIPTAFAFAIKDATGLIVLRFFIGVLGATFVPCQVWSTGFFDKNIVGTANAFTGGFGNSGGGITYFVMPAIFDHLEHHYHLTAHVAWRRAFFVPFALIVATAILLLLLTPDTPMGKWSERQQAIEANLRAEGMAGRIGPQSGVGGEECHDIQPSRSISKGEMEEKMGDMALDVEQTAGEVIDAEYTHEIVVKPSPMEMLKVCFSQQTVVLMACYFCSFGSELAINSILGAYYLRNFPTLGQTSAGRLAAMFGILNIYGRPLGGIVSDLLYKHSSGNLWAKKAWIHTTGIITGIFMIAIGVLDSKNRNTMIGLVAGLAFFMDAGNGANFSLVPHVHPFANGIVSGSVGAMGNLGGIIGAIIFRYNGVQYGKSIWILGVISIALNLAVCWIRPIPKGQIGGR